VPLKYAGPRATSNAIGYTEHYSRSNDAVIRVYDDAGNVIETHRARGRFQSVVSNAAEVFGLAIQ